MNIMNFGAAKIGYICLALLGMLTFGKAANHLKRYHLTKRLLATMSRLCVISSLMDFCKAQY